MYFLFSVCSVILVSVLLSSVGGRTSFYIRSYIPARRSFYLYPSIFQLFFAFERPEPLAILPDLPEPTYLSLPIFPLVLHRRESF